MSVIQWAQSTYKTLPDGTRKLISKYDAAKRLRITATMLKNWIKNKLRIMDQTKHSRRGKVLGRRRGVEHVMETMLYAEFQAARAKGQQIGCRWFSRHAKAIYRKLYPNRIIYNGPTLRITYLNFKFSNGWF